MSTFTSPFTGTVITPTDVSYTQLAITANTQLYWPVEANGTEAVASRIIDASSSADGLILALPDASQGAVGSDILIRNLGSHSIIVSDATGGNTVTLNAGIALYFYLQNNTTVAGSWGEVTFGAGTAVASAAALVGAGLTTVSGRLATSQNIADISTTPTINDASRATTYHWVGGLGTINLPIASSLSTGWYIGFRNGGTGALTINVTSPATINGGTSVVANPGDSGFIFFDYNTQTFFTVGLADANAITFTAGTYDVDAVVGNTLNLTAFAPIIQTYISQGTTRTQTLAVTLPAITQLYILSNVTGDTGYNVTFQLQGSSQTPIALGTGVVLTVLSNGTTLQTVAQSSTGSTYINNGTASAPAYSFTSDPHSGMYLDGVSVLGLSANSTELIRMDNSNTLLPLVTINARVAANLISGGVFP